MTSGMPLERIYEQSSSTQPRADEPGSNSQMDTRADPRPATTPKTQKPQARLPSGTNILTNSQQTLHMQPNGEDNGAIEGCSGSRATTMGKHSNIIAQKDFGDHNSVNGRSSLVPVQDRVLKGGSGWTKRKTLSLNHHERHSGVEYYEIGNKRDITWKLLEDKDESALRCPRSAVENGRVFSWPQSLTGNAHLFRGRKAKTGNERAGETSHENTLASEELINYFNDVISLAEERRVPWPTETLADSEHVRIFVQGEAYSSWEMTPERLIDMVKNQPNDDDLCIIENITPSWIAALGSAWDLPGEFFVGHAANTEKPKFWECVERNTKERIIADLNDLLQQISNVEFNIKKLPQESKKSMVDISERLTALGEAIEGIKVLLEFYYAAGVIPESQFQDDVVQEAKNLRDICKEMISEIESRIDGISGSEDADEILINSKLNKFDEVQRRLRTLQEHQQRQFYNLDGVFEYPDHDWTESLPAIDPRRHENTLYFSRQLVRNPCWPGFISNTKLSYIRVDKHICLILVDSPIPEIILRPRRAERCRIQLRLNDAHNWDGIVLPQLLFRPKLRLFDSMRTFAFHKWHLEIVCGETQICHGHQNAISQPLYAAVEVQPLLYLLSSSLWETNFRHLERSIKRISYKEIRKPGPSTNDRFLDNREDLALLKGRVSATEAGMPPDLINYYNRFSTVKGRLHAAFYSPVENHKRVLERAKELEDLLMGSVQLLVSYESMQASHRANLLTGLAFVFVPLTLVTGIFGMNITSAQNGFEWWTPLVALGAFLTLSTLSYAVARYSKRRTSRKSGRDRMDEMA